MADTTVILETTSTTVVTETVVPSIIISAAQGPPGTSVNPSDYFQTVNNFSELDTEQKKIAARQNLELQYIDCGTFN